MSGKYKKGSFVVENQIPKLGDGAYPNATPVRYPNVFAIERTKGPERLVIGPATDHIEVLLSLANVWKRDYFVLYVLLLPRLGKRKAGRYQSPGPLTFDQVSKFCRQFAPFLQGDGRHHLWIGSTVNAGMLIYDQHDWIWAYGDLSAYISVLESKGFSKDEVKLPVPHSHGYNAAMDRFEDEVAEYWNWVYRPLQAGDD